MHPTANATYLVLSCDCTHFIYVQLVLCYHMKETLMLCVLQSDMLCFSRICSFTLTMYLLEEHVTFNDLDEARHGFVTCFQLFSLDN